MKFLNKLILLWITGLFCLCPFIPAHADTVRSEVKDKYILVINSYLETNSWAGSMVNAVIQYAAGDNSLWVYQEYLNLLFVDTPEEFSRKEEYLFSRYRKKPDLLVLLGNASWVLLRERIGREWSDIPVILCSEASFTLPPRQYIVSEEIEASDISPIEKSVRGYNLTLIDGNVQIKNTIGLMKRVIPEMKKLVFVSDRLGISAEARYEIKDICARYFPDVELALLTEGKITTDMLIDSLSSYNKSVGILFFSWCVKDHFLGNNYLSNNLQKTIGSLSSSPVFFLRDMNESKLSMAGGYFCTVDEYRNKMLEVLDRIMNGIPPSRIPFQQPGVPQAYLNYRNLEAFGLDPSHFPRQAVYYQKPRSFYETYKSELWAGGAAFFVLLLAILVWVRGIQKRKQLQEEEVRLLSRYKDLINNMPIVYFRQRLIFNRDGRLAEHRLLDMNPLFKKKFARYEAWLSESENDPDDLFRIDYSGLCHQVIRTRRTLSFGFCDPDQGKEYDFFVFSATLPDTVDVFGIDTTERQKGRRLLEATNQKLSVALNVADIMPWQWDIPAGVIRFDTGSSDLPYFPEGVNPVLREADFMGALHTDDRARVGDAFTRLRQGDISKVREEYRILSPLGKTGEYDWIETLAIVFDRDENGEPLSLIGSSRIINRRKIVEEDLREAKEKADESNRLKSAFLANMSHEIRTPLNAIVGFSEILAAADDPEEKKEYVEIIQNNNTLLLQLISDILDLSKIEAGTLEFHYSDVELDSLLKEVERTSRLRLHTDRVEIFFEQGIPGCRVYTERNRLLQVITNFITNAIKFTDRGSIRFGYRMQEAGKLYFYVTDTGCGIPAGQLKRVFGRFVKLNHFAQGTGLGLSICETIIHKMEGEIGATSREGHGSTFWFTLPYRPAVHGPESAASPKRQEPLEPVEKDKLTLLIAEDDPGNYRLYESLLKKEYTLIHAWDGEEAVELFKEHRPHLILMDIKMPRLDGYQATEKIRELSSTVPVIAVTAYAFADDEQQILKNGFDAYASKPLNGKDLKEKILRLLKKRLIFI